MFRFVWHNIKGCYMTPPELEAERIISHAAKALRLEAAAEAASQA